MDIKQVARKQKNIINSTLKNKISLAIKNLSELAFASRNSEFISRFENIEQTYKNILKYSFGYAKDPERDVIYRKLKRELIELTDDTVAVIRNNSNDWLSMQRKNYNSLSGMGEGEISQRVDEMNTEHEFSDLLDEIEPIEARNSEGKAMYQKSLQEAFNRLWLTDRYRDSEYLLVKGLLGAKNIPWHDKSLIVSAISLSLLRHFDSYKVELLFDIYVNADKEIWHRSLVGLVFSMMSNEARLSLYPELTNRFKTIAEPSRLGNQIEQIIIQIIKAQETEKVTEKIQKEIIPEVMKLRPDIEEKLKLDEMLNKDKLEEKNPDWEDFFSETPGVYEKLEEFSMMQMDGSDVFMGAFSMLKRFGFFEGLSNWFLPFYKEHPEIQKSINGVEDSFNWKSFFEGIEKAPVMCNSDKYSFSFNIGFMPDMQKNMMLEMFDLEMQQMKELADEQSKHDKDSKDKTYFTQYIQDMYRFFKLHPNKNNFEDVFTLKLDVTNSEFLSLCLSGKNLRQIGEFYFKNDYFKEARDIFNYLLKKERKFELIEKVGFCYQREGNYEEAIDYYKQAEILDTNRTWLHKKLGYCYRALGQFNDAIEYYTKVEHLETENLDILVLLGQLHIDKEDYETALKYYFKVEYIKPDLLKVQRPLAWCNFLLGKLDQALLYFKKVASVEGQRSDFLNLGHCLWAKGEVQEAIENYRSALRSSGGDSDWFIKAISSDSIYLKGYQINEIDISLMADHITYYI